MKRVFIDTNIYLAFYEVTKDDLEKLTEAFKLASEQEIEFITTKQVMDEFSRRRNGIVASSLKQFSELRIPGLPAMAKGLAEMDAFISARKSLSSSQKDLTNALQNNAEQVILDADIAVRNLFDVSRVVESPDDLIRKASIRIDCGNPPGKKGSLGDAINWEALLSLDEFTDDLVIVSQDSDYRDSLNKGAISGFLFKEWRRRHSNGLILFQSLSDFINACFPGIDVTSFSLVDSKITSLAGSSSFAETHAAIAELSAVTYFTRKQAIRLTHILDENNQVNWIFGDPDVRAFYEELLANCGDKMDIYEVNYLEEMLAYDGVGNPPIYIPF